MVEIKWGFPLKPQTVKKTKIHILQGGRYSNQGRDSQWIPYRGPTDFGCPFEMKPPMGPQVLVFGSICQESMLGTSFLTHRRFKKQGSTLDRRKPGNYWVQGPFRVWVAPKLQARRESHGLYGHIAASASPFKPAKHGVPKLVQVPSCASSAESWGSVFLFGCVKVSFYISLLSWVPHPRVSLCDFLVRLIMQTRVWHFLEQAVRVHPNSSPCRGVAPEKMSRISPIFDRLHP